jgi:NitT/TauT family transport system substrate-binding protein
MKRLTRSTLVAAAALLSWTIAAPAQTLKVGVVGTTSDAPFFIAARKGFFKEEGLSVEFIQFDSAAKMIAPLGIGDLDVGGGATSAALYNAASRSVNIRIVADKAKNSKGFGFQSIMVRKDLEGRIKSFADLKGAKVAISAAGNSEAFLLDRALRTAGLTIDDVETVFLGFSQHPAAFMNKAIDASVSTEPTTTNELKINAAFKLAGVDTYYPNFQTAVTFYSGEFIAKRPDAAKKFMKALLRGMRFYRDNLTDGHLAGPQAQEIIDIMVQDSPLKNPQIYRDIISNDVDPNGVVDEASLRAVWQFFKDQKQIDGRITLDEVLDTSFARAAAAELGPYRPARAR